MSSRFAGRTAVVTGAAGGIGRATALRLALDGAAVLAVDRSEEGLEETASLARAQETTLGTLLADVTLPGAAEEVISQAEAAFGPLRMLVNNAGIGGAHRAEETDDAEFARFLETNLAAVFRFSRAGVRRMRAAIEKDGGGASIVNIASIFGMAGFPGGVSYAAAKAGVIGLTRQMAADYGRAGIRVNAISPGLIETNMTRRRLDTSPWFRGLMSEMTPIDRYGRPEDIAGAASFLCSEDASFISGQTLVVDGGWLATRYREGLDNLPPNAPLP